jgi:hypothetical protein
VIHLWAWAALGCAQDDTRQEIERLKKRVEELERKAETGAWTEIRLGPTKLKIYGFIRLDVIYDDSRADFPGAGSTIGLIGFVRSEDPNANPNTIGARENDNQLFVTPRLTRLGFDFDGPEIELLGAAKVTGKLEIDFYNGGSESRNIPRDRHFYLKLAWGELSFLAGQTSDVVSPIFPVVNSDNVMWGMGNTGDRRPQVRFEFAPAVGAGKLVLQVAGGLTGAVDAQALSAFGPAPSRLNGEASGRPTLQALVAYRAPLWEKQDLEVGVWGHRGWEETDLRINGDKQFDSALWGLHLILPLYESIAWFKGEIWAGHNLSDVRGGNFQDINNRGSEIRASGGWAEIGVRALAWLELYIGTAIDNPVNRDLTPFGVGGGNSAGRQQNVTFYAAVRVLASPVEIGLDYLYVATTYLALGHGDDHRGAIYFAYRF